jgi:hypothetical protein
MRGGRCAPPFSDRQRLDDREIALFREREEASLSTMTELILDHDPADAKVVTIAQARTISLQKRSVSKTGNSGQTHRRPLDAPFAETNVMNVHPRRDQREPNALGIQILVDGSAVGGGEAMIGKIEPGRYGSVVPAFAPLELPLGQHTLGLKNWHTLPEGSNVSYGGNHYAPIRGSASPRGRVRFA